jgi:hypothetical protein
MCPSGFGARGCRRPRGKPRVLIQMEEAAAWRGAMFSHAQKENPATKDVAALEKRIEDLQAQEAALAEKL